MLAEVSQVLCVLLLPAVPRDQTLSNLSKILCEHLLDEFELDWSKAAHQRQKTTRFCRQPVEGHHHNTTANMITLH
jgi:hypothetical protein